MKTALTKKETAVLELLSKDMTCPMAAIVLFTEASTVQSHLYRAKKKLGCHTMQGAIALYVECSHVDNCKEAHKLIIDSQYLNYKRRLIGKRF